MNDARYAEVLTQLPVAAAELEADPNNREKFDRWYSLSSELGKLLRERQDAKAGAK